MHSKYEVLSTEVCNLEDTKSFGAKAVRRDTTKNSDRGLDWTWYKQTARRSAGGIFFFFRRRDKDKTQQPHWWASPRPPAVGAFKVAETKPDNCWEAAAPRSVGAADRWLTGMRVIKGREGGESVLGQSGCDRGRSLPAVTGHVLPMAPSWTSVSGCQVSQWGSLVALHALISFTGNHCITTNVPSQPVTTALQVAKQT